VRELSELSNAGHAHRELALTLDDCWIKGKVIGILLVAILPTIRICFGKGTMEPSATAPARAISIHFNR
jgi:hypothetical protein